MMEIIKIKNIRVVDKDTDKIDDVVIENGYVVNKRYKDSECKIIDGIGKVLMPSFADLHAHFRDPGYTYKEDIVSGSKAAVKGGYTAVVLMGNTNPTCSNMDIYYDVKNRANQVGLIDVEPVITITDNLEGCSLCHLDEIDKCVKFISDDGKGVVDDDIMTKALKISKDKNIIVMSHAEDNKYSKTDMRKAENIMTKRDIDVCSKVNGNLHMCHVSTKEAMKHIIDAKKDGVNVTCEITPHHLFFTNDVSNYRVNPPIREELDVQFLINAIKNGYVDAISTDHAPHTKEDKQNGAPGISGLETSFGVCYTKLVKNNEISLSKLSEIMSYNPFKIMGEKKGLIKDSYKADLVIIDLNKKIKIDEDYFVSKGKNSPFVGYELFGDILVTLKEGKIVYSKIS